MKKIITFLLLILSPFALVFAQTMEVRGVVKDANDGTPLEGVVVYVPGTKANTTTLRDGSYAKLHTRVQLLLGLGQQV